MSDRKPRVLYVENAQHAIGAVSTILRHVAHYEVDVAVDGLECLEKFAADNYDLVLIGGGYLEKLDGIVLCIEIRRYWAGPVVFFSTRVMEEDQALKYGADYFFTQPMIPRNLIPALESLMAPPASEGLWGEVCLVNGVEVQLSKPWLVRNGKKIWLTVMESRLLRYLMINCGRVVTRTELYRLWQYPEGYSSRFVVDAHLHRLREKLGGEKGRLALFPWDAGGYLSNLIVVGSEAWEP